MTRNEWSVLAGFVQAWWIGDFTDNDEAGWWPAMRDHNRDDVLGALRRALRRHPKFRPTLGELLEILEGAGRAQLPTFAELAAAVDGGTRRAARANSVQAQVTGRVTPEAEQALYDHVADLAGPVAAAFVQTEGYRQVQRWGLDDPDHGPARYRMIEDRWREYADRVQDRVAVGVPIERATARRLARGGLRPLDALAVLGRDPDQLELTEEAAS